MLKSSKPVTPTIGIVIWCRTPIVRVSEWTSGWLNESSQWYTREEVSGRGVGEWVSGESVSEWAGRQSEWAGSRWVSRRGVGEWVGGEALNEWVGGVSVSEWAGCRWVSGESVIEWAESRWVSGESVSERGVGEGAGSRWVSESVTLIFYMQVASGSKLGLWRCPVARWSSTFMLCHSGIANVDTTTSGWKI